MEPSFLDAIRTFPLPFVGAVLASMLGLGIVVFSSMLLARRRWWAFLFSALAGMLGVTAVGSGLIGFFVIRSQADAASTAPMLEPSGRSVVRAYGHSQAHYPLAFGLGAGALPLMGACVVAMGALSRRRNDRER